MRELLSISSLKNSFLTSCSSAPSASIIQSSIAFLLLCITPPRPVAVTMSTNDSLPEGFDPRFTEYYNFAKQCTTNYCPDAYYDYTDKCNVNICPLDSSNWDYLPSLPANGIFIALFSLSLALYLGQGVLSRRFWGFTIAMVGGSILEVLGYAGRIMSYYKPWSQVCRWLMEARKHPAPS